MEMQSRRRGEAVTVSVSGEIKGVEIVVLCRRIEALADQGCACLSVDLSKVTAIDSYGVGGLTYTDILFKKRGIRFIIVVPAESPIKAVFTKVNLDRVLTIVDKVDGQD